MTASKRRVKVVLKLPTSVSSLLTIARLILAKMTGNPAFPSPMPSLAAVDAAITALADAQVTTLTGARGKTAARDERLAALNGLLLQLAAYVEGVANVDMETAAATIESAGMSVKKRSTAAKPPFALKQGRVSGEVIATVRAAGKLVEYEFQVSFDGGKTWQSWRRVIQAKAVLSRLPAGTTCWFRYRALLRTGHGDWSDVLSFLVK